MFRFLFISYLLFYSTFIIANDGSFYAQGGTLLPLEETTIELRKEVLNLTQDGHWMQVDIFFEFYNPATEKELTVGFVTPPASGDVLQEEAEHPQVEGFQVMVNEALSSFKISRQKGTGMKIPNQEMFGNEFVYHFPVVFKKGKNTIRHSYKYRGSNSVESKHYFDYRLTTGKLWANKGIGDFELNIKMEDNTYFGLPYSFWKDERPVSWEMIGVGQISAKKQRYYSDINLQMAKVKTGTIQFRAKNFRPDSDLYLMVLHPHNHVSFWTDNKPDKPLFFNDIIFSLYPPYDKEGLKELSKENLRILRNYVFAKHGYIFKSKDLQAYFEQFNWYIPNPMIQNIDKLLTKEDRDLLEIVKELEDKK